MKKWTLTFDLWWKVCKMTGDKEPELLIQVTELKVNVPWAKTCWKTGNKIKVTLNHGNGWLVGLLVWANNSGWFTTRGIQLSLCRKRLAPPFVCGCFPSCQELSRKYTPSCRINLNPPSLSKVWFLVMYRVRLPQPLPGVILHMLSYLSSLWGILEEALKPKTVLLQEKSVNGKQKLTSQEYCA